MPAKELSPIEVYELLPGTNCKECGESNCMSFSVRLVNKEASLMNCIPLLDPEKQVEYDKLWKMLKPPIRSVEVGVGDRKVTLGGEYVVYRHEFTYFNQTAIAIDVSDEMPDEEFKVRINRANTFSYDYIGMTLYLDMIAIRSISGDPKVFSDAVSRAVELSELPIILCTNNPKVMEAGLAASKRKRPLIYAANRSNWREMADLALKYECPIVVSSPFDLDTLKSLATSLWEYGIEDIVLDPGTGGPEDISTTINNFTMLRQSAISKEDEMLGFPVLGTPIVAWSEKQIDPSINEWNEAVIASSLIVRYSDAMIIHATRGWALLPLVILRQNIYTDPRKPVSVEPGVQIYGNPDKNSPVLLTTNFALTFYTVASDIESGAVDCYLIVIDTEGISVESAVAGRKLTSENISEALDEYKVSDLVDHRQIIIPGRAARLSGEIEEVSGWKVSVGPMDSSEIPKYVEGWKPEPKV